MPGVTLLTEWCNIFGAESGGGRMLGGLGESAPSRQWYCDTRAVGHFFMRCEHGHKGQTMPLCIKHYNEFRKAVSFCPRCNMDPRLGHKCELRLIHIS